MITDIIPEAKDFERAEGLRYRHGTKETRPDGSGWESSAEAMVKLIKDKDKLIRRAKAVVATYGTYMSSCDNFVWRPFYKGLFAMGCTVDEVYEIERYRR